MRIVVLGGAGKMGSISVQDLALHQNVDEVIIADHNPDAARIVADYIDSPKCSFQRVNLHDHAALVSLLVGADACINATVYYTNLLVMEACLEARVHYTDLGGLFHLTGKQLKLHDRFAEAGVSAVLGMGSAVGVTNIQARYAADHLDTIEYVRFYDGIMPPPPDQAAFTYAVPTIIDEMTRPAIMYLDGEFIELDPLAEFEEYMFVEPIGVLPMHHSLHSEVATIPLSFKDKGLKECFFKINYWGMPKELVEKVMVLAEFGFAREEAIKVGGAKITPRDFLIAMMGEYVPPVTAFLEPPAAQPPDWRKEIVTEVKGTVEGNTIVYRLGTATVKGALPTGVVPARGAVWQAEGRVPPGVRPSELSFANPGAFLKELEDREIYTTVTVRRGI